MPYFALFDDAVSGRAKLYQNHVESRLSIITNWIRWTIRCKRAGEKGCMLCCLQTTNSVCR